MNEIFNAIYDRLVAQLVTPTVPVFDHVPQDHDIFPYVRIDPLELDNNDTDNETGFTGTIQIIGFSRYRGTLEVADLKDKIYDALHQWPAPDTTSFGISTIHQEFGTIATETDGLTRQSIQRFRVTFEPLPV